MRCTSLWSLGAAVSLGALVTVPATAADPGEVKINATVVQRPVRNLPKDTATATVEADPEPIAVGAPIRPDAKVHRIVVMGGPEGNTVTYAGTVSGVQPSCEEASNSAYCNTLSPVLRWFEGRPDVLIADDIALAKAAPCTLDRFVIRVTGDRLQDGTGAALGEYTVTYALYETCPSVGDPPIIRDPFTGEQAAGQVTIPASQAGDIVEIVHTPTADITLPTNELYLGISFSRAKCAVLAGAPATKGFSADHFSYSTLCRTGWGGGVFPRDPHSSFYAEFYVRDNCVDTFVGYRNTDQRESGYSAGPGIRFADDITLEVPECNVVAFEYAFKDAIVGADLRTHLDDTDPDHGGVIPGIGQCSFLPTEEDVEIAHCEVDPPYPLPPTFWISFRSGSGSSGPIKTCRKALVGETANFWKVYDSGSAAWVDRLGGDCWGGFDVTIYCEGSAPKGACCDMYLTECLGGPNDGKPCFETARVCEPGGTCESVCRELPEIACSSWWAGRDRLYKEGERCGPVCVGGGKEAEHCARDADCVVCVGGTNDGQPCDSGCPNGACDVATGLCAGGDRDGQECCPDGGTCPTGTCEGSFCDGGPRHGQPCTRQADCLPDGECRGGPFGNNPCGTSACCSFVTEEDPLACENLTLPECGLRPHPIQFNPGKFCSIAGLSCPLAACMGRFGNCFLPRPTFCEGGTRDGEECDLFAFPSPCWENSGRCAGDVLQECQSDAQCGGLGPCLMGGNCEGGPNDGQLCDINAEAPCGKYCENNPSQTCSNDENCGASGPCVEWECARAFCRGSPGCSDQFCCTAVCSLPGQIFCCTDHWDQLCANSASVVCEFTTPSNDECFERRFTDRGARLIRMSDTVEGDCLNSTEGADPVFCCHEESPGSAGFRTVWFKFIATDTSVKLTTCNSDARPEGLAEDSLLQVFSVADPERGICRDGSECRCQSWAPDATCDVLLEPCADGFECELDEEAACEGLNTIACADNDPGVCADGSECGCKWAVDESCAIETRPCRDGSDCTLDRSRACDPIGPGNLKPNRASVCVTDLVVGHPYYVMMAAKSDRIDPRDPEDPDDDVFPDLGVYRLDLIPSCSVDVPPLHNDICQNAEELTGGDTEPLVVPFDLSGGGSEASATLECPGPPSWCTFALENDSWYKWTAPCDGEVTFDTCDTFCIRGTNLGIPCTTDSECGLNGECRVPDTGMVVYQGCECPAEDGRILGCSEFGPGGIEGCLFGSSITTSVQAGECYLVRLGGNLGGTPAGHLTVTATCDCAVGTVTFVDPPNGVVDARQPHPPWDVTEAQGITQIEVQAPAGAAAGNGACWSLCETGGGDPPQIVDLLEIDDRLFLTLDRPITPGQATTLTYKDYLDGSEATGTFLFHPGNTNGDGQAAADDIAAFIDCCLQGQCAPSISVEEKPYRCDIDHNRQIGPADFLRLLDLLNAAETHDDWLGTAKPSADGVCPPPGG